MRESNRRGASPAPAMQRAPVIGNLVFPCQHRGIGLFSVAPLGNSRLRLSRHAATLNNNGIRISRNGRWRTDSIRMMDDMKRIGYAGLFLMVGVFFPILIWFAGVVAIKRALVVHRESRSMRLARPRAEPDHAASPAIDGEYAPRY